jgi:ATP phosphoribosyltransferase regulatory subunit
MPRWALPDYIEDLLPDEAMRVERVRRALIDTCTARKFALVQPPLIEYVDSLKADSADLDDHMFRVVDQLSGRLLGVRADMTPQAARIDAHLFADRAENRLCYAGSVLHTQPTALNPTREVVQGGAELYGVSALNGDVETLSLLIEIAQRIGLTDLHIDLGHSRIFPALTVALGLNSAALGQARHALQRKDRGALHAITPDASLAALLSLYGDAGSTLADARRVLGHNTEVAQALDDLEAITRALAKLSGKVTVDLADVPNYGYHTGVVYAMYVPGEFNAIARGGRYDNIGLAYGAPAPRAATGFSMDLRLAAASMKE